MTGKPGVYKAETGIRGVCKAETRKPGVCKAETRKPRVCKALTGKPGVYKAETGKPGVKGRGETDGETVQDEVNQWENKHDELVGTKKGADFTGVR